MNPKYFSKWRFLKKCVCSLKRYPPHRNLFRMNYMVYEMCIMYTKCETCSPHVNTLLGSSGHGSIVISTSRHFGVINRGSENYSNNNYRTVSAHS